MEVGELQINLSMVLFTHNVRNERPDFGEQRQMNLFIESMQGEARKKAAEPPNG